jgi:hypothetical protein
MTKGMGFFGDLLDKIIDVAEWWHVGAIAQAVYAAYPEIEEDASACLKHLKELAVKIGKILSDG